MGQWSDSAPSARTTAKIQAMLLFRLVSQTEVMSAAILACTCELNHSRHLG